MSSTASTSITTSPTKAAVSASPSSGIGTTTPTTTSGGMTMTTSNSGGISPLEQEIFALKAQLAAVSAEKNVLQETLRNIQGETSPEDCDPSTFPSQSSQQSAAATAVYEARLTELHSVIAELKKQLDIRREQIIPEESTDFEEDFELDTEDLISIDENPSHNLSAEDKSLKMNFINSKTTKVNGDSSSPFGRGRGNIHNFNNRRNNHLNNSNHSTILLTTPSDDEDELESSSGMNDPSPVNNHNDDNNLPSDVDVDGDYFEDDQIITTESFGLKCVEYSDNQRNGTGNPDVIDTEGMATWIVNKAVAADSNNCNLAAPRNPLNHDYSSSTIQPLETKGRGGKVMLKTKPFSKQNVHHNLHASENSLDFSPLSSPESPPDENNDVEEGGQQRESISPDVNTKFCGGSVDAEDEEEGGENEDPMKRKAFDRGDHENDDIHSNDTDDNEKEKVGLCPLSKGRSSVRIMQTEQLRHYFDNNSRGVGTTSPQLQQNHHRSKHVSRRHRRGSGSRRRNRDTNFIGQTFTSSSALVPTSGRALEIQDRERLNHHSHTISQVDGGNNKAANQHVSSLLTITSKPEKLRGEFILGSGVGSRLHHYSSSSAISPGGFCGVTAMRTTPSDSPSPEAKPPVQFASLCQEVAQIRQEHAAIKDNLYRKEGELDRTRSALENIAKERDFLKNKVSELEHLLKQSPKRLPQNFSPADLTTIPVDDNAPICKIAERVKLSRSGVPASPSATPQSNSNMSTNKHQQSQNCGNPNFQSEFTPSPEVNRKSSSRHSRSHHHKHNSNSHSRNLPHHHRQQQQQQQQEHHLGLTGHDLMLIGPVCSTRVVEHLVQPIKTESALREMQHSLIQNGVSPMNEEKLKEFEIETERLSSKIEHLRSQNDVLTLNLEDAKGQADRLTVLLGKYESNNVALQLAVGYSDHTIEAYDILVALLESELGQLLANLRATGIGATSNSHTSQVTSTDEEDTLASTSVQKSQSQSTYNNALSCPLPAIQIQGPPISSSGNNNNSNDNSPTGEHSFSPNCVASSSATTTTTATTLIVATATTTTTTSNSPFSPQEELDIRALIERANENRLTAENAARVLLSRFSMVDSPGSENNNSSMVILPHHHPHQNGAHNPTTATSSGSLPGQQPLPWEETSSCSHTLSSASSLGDTSNGSPSKPGSRQGGDIMKNEECRIRDLIITLKTEREQVRQTVTEVDSWSLESMYPSKPPSPCDILEARKLDLETAVLMQELMAMREERAELRAQLFLLEKEKSSLELRLQSHETQEEAYKARINYLKSEILDYQNSVADSLTIQKVSQNQQQMSPDGNANNSAGGGSSSPGTCPPSTAPTERELVLKKRIQELASALEKVTHTSKMREKQNHEMISELKRANGILIETLEAVKRKYQSRIRKMEEQIMAIMERHTMQIKLHKDRIHYLEMENKEQRLSQQQLTSD